MFRNRILTIKFLGNYSDCEDIIDICLIKHRDPVDKHLVSINGVKMNLISSGLDDRDKDFHYFENESEEDDRFEFDYNYDAVVYVKPTKKDSCHDDWRDEYKQNWETNAQIHPYFKNTAICRKLVCVAIDYDPTKSSRPWDCLSEIPALIQQHKEEMKKLMLLGTAANFDNNSAFFHKKILKDVTALIQFSLFKVSTPIHQYNQNPVVETMKNTIDMFSDAIKRVGINFSKK